MENQTPQQPQVNPVVTQSQPIAILNQSMDNETIRLKVRLFQLSLWSSLAIIIALTVLIILTHLFPGGHPPSDPYNQYMTSYARIQFVVAFLLVPALYGTFAWIPIKHLRNGKSIKSKFFIGIIPVGIVSACIGYLGSGFEHIDCGNVCASDVPSDHLMLVSFLVATAVTTIGPILAIVRLGKLNGNPKIIRKVVKTSVITIVLLTIIIGCLVGWIKYQNAHQQLFCNGVTVKSYQDKACTFNN